jgi:hypothetical protein
MAKGEIRNGSVNKEGGIWLRSMDDKKGLENGAN